MQPQNLTLQENDFNSIMTATAADFGARLRKTLAEMLGVETRSLSAPGIDMFPALKADFAVSILFIGTVFGEFMISLSRETARGICAAGEDPATCDDDQIRDTLAEVLNMVVGQCVRQLSETYPKITMTAPRIIEGAVTLRRVRSAQVTLDTAAGSVGCILYIDQMKLDIASSYRDVIANLTLTNGQLEAANSKLKEQQTQLVHSEKMASLGVMAAGVAHEINNPLAFVSGNIEVLETYTQAMGNLLAAYERLSGMVRDGKIDELRGQASDLLRIKAEEDIDFVLGDTRKLILRSREGLGRIRGIVNGLRKFSRAEADAPVATQLNDEIEGALMLVESQLRRRARVEKSLAALPPVECSPGPISQVFVNLLVNAAQAIPEGRTGLVRVSSALEGDHVAIRVADDGVGMSEEVRKQVFQPFFTTKAIGEGTGLGLAISYGIVQKHGGSIEVRSEPGKGTEFKVLLPLRRP